MEQSVWQRVDKDVTATYRSVLAHVAEAVGLGQNQDEGVGSGFAGFGGSGVGHSRKLKHTSNDSQHRAMWVVRSALQDLERGCGSTVTNFSGRCKQGRITTTVALVE